MKTKVTIEGGEQTERGTSSQGKPYEERYQQAYLHDGGRFPKSCRLRLFDNARPYQPGDYETDQTLEVSDYNRLQVKRDLDLTLVAPAKA